MATTAECDDMSNNEKDDDDDDDADDAGDSIRIVRDGSDRKDRNSVVAFRRVRLSFPSSHLPPVLLPLLQWPLPDNKG